ncbi:MAG TPA: FAD-dependent oxidoreductase [Bryobacteraceae bacterium]|nr:FAD-dependent oxidoreductase [Bryobacteraceae bacterium]
MPAISKPVLLAVDDEPEVLRAIERDLRRKYAQQYRIVRAESGPSALDALKQLQLRNDQAALLLSDQRMPGMQGTEFLTEAGKLFPRAKRVLLTAYADTNAAIDAINSARTDYYLLKPWSPPEENFYPVIDDLLNDWTQEYRPPWSGIRLLGNRWSPDAHELRDFMGRNRIPFQWLDIDARDNDRETSDLLKALGPENKFPVVLFEDGSHLCRPTIGELAEKLGLRTTSEKPFYDFVIVGGGPAGLAAAVYAASEGLDTVLIEREAPGGQAGMSSRIENYLGFPQGVSGGELAQRAVAQARKFSVEMLAPQEVRCLGSEGPYRSVTLADGSSINAFSLLIATGLAWRSLDVPGVERLRGAGVYYGAAMTEAESCRDQDVFVVGGANSAGQGAMYFSRHARRVIMVVRAESLSESMSQYLIDQIEKTPNIEVWTKSEVLEAHGETHLEELSIVHREDDRIERLPASGLFIFIGACPRTEWLDGVLPMDERGFILTGPYLSSNGSRPKGWPLDRDPYLFETAVPGVFAAGDVRHGSVKRVASGVGEGSVVVQMVHQYLAKVK